MKSILLIDGSDTNRLAADVGSYQVAGGTISLYYYATPPLVLSADGSGFALSFRAAAGGRGYAGVSAGGRYTLAGQPAGARRGYVLHAASGAFAIAGTAASYVRRDAPGSRPIVLVLRRPVMSVPRRLSATVAGRRIHIVEAA